MKYMVMQNFVVHISFVVDSWIPIQQSDEQCIVKNRKFSRFVNDFHFEI